MTVQHNGVYSFKISYNKDKSTILQNITVNGEVFTFKDGFVPIKITGNAEYKVDSYIKWGSYYADFYLTNITSDLVIEINCEKQPASEMAFTISDRLSDLCRREPVKGRGRQHCDRPRIVRQYR